LFCFIAAAVLAKLVIGFMLAGVAGLTLFGAYGGMVSHTSDALSSLSSVTQSAELDPRFTPLAILKREGAKAIWINVLPIFLLYAPALLALLIGVTKNTAMNVGEQGKTSLRKDFMILSFLVITSLVTIITFYQLILISKMMGAAELYWRYYEFSFPLLYLVVAASLESEPIIKKNLRLFLLLMTAIAMFLVIWAIYRGAGTEWISFGKKPTVFYISGGLSIFILGLSLIRPIWAFKIFIWIALPFILITSNLAIYHHLQKTRITPNDSNVGQFINNSDMSVMAETSQSFMGSANSAGLAKYFAMASCNSIFVENVGLHLDSVENFVETIKRPS
jgi:phosphoglycerol transferase